MKAPYLSDQWFELIDSVLNSDLSEEYFRIGYAIKNSPFGDVIYQVGIGVHLKTVQDDLAPRHFYLKKTTQDLTIPNLGMDYLAAKRILVGQSSIATEIGNGEIKLFGDVAKLTDLNDLAVNFKEFQNIIISVTDLGQNRSEVFLTTTVETSNNLSGGLTADLTAASILENATDEKDLETSIDSNGLFFEEAINHSFVDEKRNDLESDMEILSSRILLRPSNLQRSKKFYRDDLGLAVFREFGEGDSYGIVFYLGGGFLEVSGTGSVADPSISIWLQVRDIKAVAEKLKGNNILITKGPTLEPWGLIEMWVSDPDGVRLYFVEVPEGHPLRVRSAE